MKRLGQFLLLMLLLQACDVKKEVNGIPTDPEERAELFEKIINDEKHFNEFIQLVHEDENAMMQMRQNRRMMNSMMGGKGMQRQMQNPKMRRSMMQLMMKDSVALRDMLQMMRDRKMLNEECAQQARDRMQEMQTKAKKDSVK